MSGGVLTTWGVVLDVDADAAVAAEADARSTDAASPGHLAAAWFERGRRAFFDRCPRLASFLREEDGVLSTSAERIDPLPPGAPAARIAVSVIEVRQASFDMAFRARTWTDTQELPTNGRCTVAILRRASGEAIPLPRDIRDEFIAIQLGARGYL